MQLVILAAGHGRRFGGLKQLAPVGPNDEAIMDFTANSALASGYDGVVLVVREEIRARLARHTADRWPRELPVELVCQGSRPGTVQAVASAGPLLDGPFAVANADDHYGTEALTRLLGSLATPTLGTSAPRHGLVAYELANTLVSPATVKRGLCEVGTDGSLCEVVEHEIRRTHDGLVGRPLGHEEVPERSLSGTEPVSMNLWGFQPSMLEHLEAALEAAPDGTSGPELILPDVVGALVRAGRVAVQVLETGERCIGVTHREDLQIVRDELAGGPAPPHRLSAARG